MTDLFEDSPNDQKKADELINAGHLDIVNRSPLSLVFNEDCVAGMKRFSDGHFDLAIVDPPYGIGAGKGVGVTRGCESHYKIKDWDSEIPTQEYFDELFRVSKNQIIFGGNYMTAFLKPSRGWIYWRKLIGGNYADGELAWTSFDRNLKEFTKRSDQGNRFHPTQKPIKLYEWILENYAVKGNLILDTHLGSGSSRIACEKAGLDFVGFELDTDYFLSQEKRFKDHLVQGRLFGADFC